MSTKDELRTEIAQLRLAGSHLSNICFNLSQSDGTTIVTLEIAKLIREAVKDWDAVRRTERARIRERLEHTERMTKGS